MKNHRRNLYIVGGGSFARELRSWAAGFEADRFRLAGFLYDESEEELTGLSGGNPPDRVGALADFDPADGDKFLMGYDDPKMKLAVAEMLQAREFSFSGFAHASVVESSKGYASRGTIVGPYAVIGGGAMITDWVQIGAGCILGSGIVIRRGSTVGNRVTLGSNVTIGAGAVVGLASTVYPGVSIGEQARIGPGCVVRKDVPRGAVVSAVSEIAAPAAEAEVEPPSARPIKPERSMVMRICSGIPSAGNDSRRLVVSNVEEESNVEVVGEVSDFQLIALKAAADLKQPLDKRVIFLRCVSDGEWGVKAIAVGLGQDPADANAPARWQDFEAWWEAVKGARQKR